MQTRYSGRQTKAALAVGCALAFAAAGCSASVETHTVDAAGNTTTHMSKTIGNPTVTPTEEAPLNLTGEDETKEATPVPPPVTAEPAPAVGETSEVVLPDPEPDAEDNSRFPCLAKMKEIMLAEGDMTQAEIDAIPDVVLEQLFIEMAEENDMSVTMLCAVAESGMLEQVMKNAAAEETTANPGKAYADQGEFGEAVVAAGLPCDVWVPNEPQDSLVGGICWDGVNPSSAWQLYYFDAPFRDEILGQFQGLASHDAMLIGPNWAIHAEKDADVQAMIPALGGEFIPSK